MAYLSPEYLQRYDIASFSGRRMVAEAKTASIKSTVFLAHSSADDEHVERVVLFFRDFDALVYADDYDKSLPKPPTPATASTLKERIAEARRFVVLVSPNSRYSRWIPWEPGVAHGLKGVAPVAILPVTHGGNEDAWTVEEYFGLYPRVKFIKDAWSVWDPRDQKHWKLKEWIEWEIT